MPQNAITKSSVSEGEFKWLQIIPALPGTSKFNVNVLQSHIRLLELIFSSCLLLIQAEKKRRKNVSYFAPKVELFPILQGMFITNSQM